MILAESFNINGDVNVMPRQPTKYEIQAFLDEIRLDYEIDQAEARLDGRVASADLSAVSRRAERIEKMLLSEQASSQEVRRGAQPREHGNWAEHVQTMRQLVSSLINLVRFPDVSAQHGLAMGPLPASRSAPAGALPGLTWRQGEHEATLVMRPDTVEEVELSFSAPVNRPPKALLWVWSRAVGAETVKPSRYEVVRQQGDAYILPIGKQALQSRLNAIAKAQQEGRAEDVVGLLPEVQFD